jgi:Domain of unknown function (DUF3597)
MSIFGNIMGAIFGRHPGAASASPSTAPSGSASSSPSGSATAQSGAGAATGTTGTVDVEAVLREKAAKKAEKLDWRHSIVDLMKVLDLDSSFAARKELAKELHYTGALDGSAEMNIWLHKQVMTKLAENGGQVPADLKH